MGDNQYTSSTLYSVRITSGGAVVVDNETTGESVQLPQDSHAALMIRCLLGEIMIPGNVRPDTPNFPATRPTIHRRKL